MLHKCSLVLSTVWRGVSGEQFLLAYSSQCSPGCTGFLPNVCPGGLRKCYSACKPRPGSGAGAGSQPALVLLNQRKAFPPWCRKTWPPTAPYKAWFLKPREKEVSFSLLVQTPACQRPLPRDLFPEEQAFHVLCLEHCAGSLGRTDQRSPASAGAASRHAWPGHGGSGPRHPSWALLTMM